MQIAIIAGGMGTRLGELARDRPKSLVQVCGKPFLQYQLESAKRQGIADIVLCLGHLARPIMAVFGDGHQLGVNIQYSVEEKPLGTAGALKHAAHLLKDPFITLYGDSYLTLDYSAALAYFLSRDRPALMTVYRNENRYDRSNVTVAGDMVIEYLKSGRSSGAPYIDYGVSILRKEVLDAIPANTLYSLTDIFSELAGKRQLLAYEVNDRFYEIGSLQGLKDFEAYVKMIQNDTIKSTY